MKINNIFSILFVALSLLAFSCNHTPADKKEEKLNPEDKVVSALKSELEKINSALETAKGIEIPVDLLAEGKVKEGKEADVKALYKDPIFKDIEIAKDDTKEAIHGKLEALAMTAKQTAVAEMLIKQNEDFILRHKDLEKYFKLQ